MKNMLLNIIFTIKLLIEILITIVIIKIIYHGWEYKLEYQKEGNKKISFFKMARWYITCEIWDFWLSIKYKLDKKIKRRYLK